MPLTPFIGLSVMVHIIVIIEHKIFRRSSKIKDRKIIPAMKYVGFAIIFFVFAVVLTTAGVLVRASVLEKHSSVYVVSHFVQSAEAAFVPGPRPIPEDILRDDRMALDYFTNLS